MVRRTSGPELAEAVGPEGVDTQRLRKVYGRFPTGVTALAVLEGGEPTGFAASSFNTVSADPPLVAVCIQAGSTTWPKLAAAERIGVSVFADDQGAICRQMAGRGDRFAGVDWTVDGDAVLLDGAAAWMECSVAHVFTEGDHEVAILRVERHGVDEGKAPLVFGDSKFHKAVELTPPGAHKARDPFLDSLHELELGWW